MGKQVIFPAHSDIGRFIKIVFKENIISTSGHCQERKFSFADFTLSSSQIEYHTLSTMLSSGELWRIWTPMFMHFSLLHILFNLLWVWMIGGAIERLQGTTHFILLVLFSCPFLPS